MNTPSDAAAELRLSEVMAALSYALDVTEGQPEGHAVRSCLIGMRIAEALGLDVEQRSALFYGLLLKDAGCSSNSAKIASLFGNDDFDVKRRFKLADQTRPVEGLLSVCRISGSLGAFLRVLRPGSEVTKAMTELRCERGAEIARMLELPAESARAIYALDEHWDGRGHPYGLAGEEIPLLARILCLSQTVEVFHDRHGLDAALKMAQKRAGTWFDPQLVTALQSLHSDTAFWDSLRAADLRAQVSELEPPELTIRADDDRLDRVAEAFAKVIDAKSPFTFQHSARVAAIADDLAAGLGLDQYQRRELRRAALLHDIGKLTISNQILDKPSGLSDEEFTRMKQHPAFTVRILERVSPFVRIAMIAGTHHEKLDGSGYPWGLQQLSQPARILVVSDIYEALTAVRPYRDALDPSQALAIMAKEAGTKLCADSFGALGSSAFSDDLKPGPPLPGAAV
ncbi:MAG TPA: HD domain-containing phosphohydrolase [Gaiellaceae bacterium]|nr:HD domain-containing phosphohydrolase [Gaiellaceae bacterium]